MFLQFLKKVFFISFLVLSFCLYQQELGSTQEANNAGVTNKGNANILFIFFMFKFISFA
jgi:hypothetical protein